MYQPAVRKDAWLVVVRRIDEEVIDDSRLPASVAFAVHNHKGEDGKQGWHFRTCDNNRPLLLYTHKWVCVLLRSSCLPARIYMTPVTSTALNSRRKIPKRPRMAAAPSRMTQTTAHEIDKLCISTIKWLRFIFNSQRPTSVATCPQKSRLGNIIIFSYQTHKSILSPQAHTHWLPCSPFNSHIVSDDTIRRRRRRRRLIKSWQSDGISFLVTYLTVRSGVGHLGLSIGSSRHWLRQYCSGCAGNCELPPAPNSRCTRSYSIPCLAAFAIDFLHSRQIRNENNQTGFTQSRRSNQYVAVSIVFFIRVLCFFLSFLVPTTPHHVTSFSQCNAAGRKQQVCTVQYVHRNRLTFQIDTQTEDATVKGNQVNESLMRRRLCRGCHSGSLLPHPQLIQLLLLLLL